MLQTAGINQTQFPVTPNKNIDLANPSTPTFMLTPKGLTDLDIQNCLLINSLNDSAYHCEGLESDGCSNDEHSPMSTDSEMSDSEDDTVFMQREVEGCEDNFNDSLQFSTSFVAGHVTNQTKKRSFTSTKGQGSNPLANSTMIEKVEPKVVQKRCKPVSRGVSIPKASSTLLYKPSIESQRPFSPVVKLNDLEDVKTQKLEKKEATIGNANSVFTWSLQHSGTDVPLEECYLRTVRKRQMSKVMRSNKMVSRPNHPASETVNGISVIEGKLGHKSDEVVCDNLCVENPLYNQAKSIPRTSTRANIPKVSHETKASSNEEIFKKPSAVCTKNNKDGVVRKNSVVKKLLRFRESFKKKSGTTDLRTLAVM